MANNSNELDGSGGALPPLPTSAKPLLPAPFIGLRRFLRLVHMPVQMENPIQPKTWQERELTHLAGRAFTDA